MDNQQETVLNSDRGSKSPMTDTILLDPLRMGLISDLTTGLISLFLVTVSHG